MGQSVSAFFVDLVVSIYMPLVFNNILGIVNRPFLDFVKVSTPIMGSSMMQLPHQKGQFTRSVEKR